MYNSIIFPIYKTTLYVKVDQGPGGEDDRGPQDRRGAAVQPPATRGGHLSQERPAVQVHTLYLLSQEFFPLGL